MYVVGITGGIGSGKSSVSDRFREHQIEIIDTDVIARQIVQPNMPALNEISERFGNRVLAKSGELDRAALRKIVFSNRDAKQQLENILHPLIYEEAQRRIELAAGAYVIVVIPLLAESKRTYPLDRILVVDAATETRINRVVERDQQSRQAIQRIVKSQSSREARLQIANDVIENNGSLDQLYHEVDKLHQQYLLLAAKAN